MSSPNFFQSAPYLQNQFTSDPWLQQLLRWRLPHGLWPSVAQDLERFGKRVSGEMLDWAWQAEQEKPELIKYDAWGKRVDEIKLSAAWGRMAQVAAEEGIVAIGYERAQDEYSRLFQLSKLYLYHPSSAVFSCPLAMTDGAARIIEVLGSPALKDRAFKSLISRDPKQFWTSGQWMTERSGGSDVSETSTVAKVSGNHFQLYGTKWFTSAITSEMALALARIEGAGSGSRGLSLFYTELRKSDGSLNNIEVLRLKDKLGTRALPTAELELHGSQAVLLGEPGHGVRNIATMLNVTRLYNAVCSVAQMRRGLALWQDYAAKRVVFGQRLNQQPLFLETFADHLSRQVACMMLTFSTAELLGKDECGVATNGEKSLVRLLTPLAKLFTGKNAVWTLSEVIEGFGGAGYIEDTRLPVMLRDAQVFPIWEGPTNVLSLDLLRVLNNGEVWPAFDKEIRSCLSGKIEPTLEPFAEVAKERLKGLEQFFAMMVSANPESWQAVARDLAFAMSELFAGAKMLEWSGWAEKNAPIAFQKALQEVARRWWHRPMTVVRPRSNEDLASVQTTLI